MVLSAIAYNSRTHCLDKPDETFHSQGISFLQWLHCLSLAPQTLGPSLNKALVDYWHPTQNVTSELVYPCSDLQPLLSVEISVQSGNKVIMVLDPKEAITSHDEPG